MIKFFKHFFINREDYYIDYRSNRIQDIKIGMILHKANGSGIIHDLNSSKIYIPNSDDWYIVKQRLIFIFQH
jgi:hypothetical protein